MNATQLKKLEAARERSARQRTVANELPQELSQHCDLYGLPEAPVFPGSGMIGVKSIRKLTSRAKTATLGTRHPRKPSAEPDHVPEDDCHPTVLAAACGSLRTR